MSSAVQNALQAATAAVSLAAMRLRSKFGIAIAAIIAMMATTIINSISVNPLTFMSILLSKSVLCLTSSRGAVPIGTTLRPIGVPNEAAAIPLAHLPSAGVYTRVADEEF